MKRAMTASTPTPSESTEDRAYYRRLFFFLGAAGFFEGYDTFTLTQVLPAIRIEMGLSHRSEGALVAFINVGMLLAYPLVHNADRWGRKRVLTITVLGFACATLAAGLAPNVWLFGLSQLVARMFLAAEWAVATVYAAEEFPADRRGTVIGIVHGLNGFGAIACAAVAPALLATPLNWRSVYFVGALPLFLMAIARRSLRETRRFAQQAATKRGEAGSLARMLAPPLRGRLLQLSLLWALTYGCTASAITFWKEFAVSERAMSDASVGKYISIAAVVAMPLAFSAGKILDRFGRRVGALLIYGSTVGGTIGAYTLTVSAPLITSLIFGMAGITAVGVVLSAYTAELFPTELRGTAFGLSNHLLGRTAFIISPLGVGFAATHVGWGHAVAMTTALPALALLLILILLPETRGKELEDTAVVVTGAERG